MDFNLDTDCLNASSGNRDFLAVVVHQKELRFKKFFRTILVLPWAVPGFVTILVFAGMFNDSFGAINTSILAFFGIDSIPWLTSPNWTRLALLLIQGWLGFPYIFIVTTGVLQSISDDLYEAATIDGASPFKSSKILRCHLFYTQWHLLLLRNIRLILITLTLSICLMREDQLCQDQQPVVQIF